MSEPVYRRGDVYWVDFTMARGGETGKVRPAAIVSNDLSNRFANRVQVVPLTSNTARVYPSEALVELNGVTRKATADRIATATEERLGEYIGRLAPGELQQMGRALIRQLGLRPALRNLRLQRVVRSPAPDGQPEPAVGAPPSVSFGGTGFVGAAPATVPPR